MNYMRLVYVPRDKNFSLEKLDIDFFIQARSSFNHKLYGGGGGRGEGVEYTNPGGFSLLCRNVWHHKAETF